MRTYVNAEAENLADIISEQPLKVTVFQLLLGTSASLAPSATAGWAGSNAGVLVKWLQRLQFKMGQIEMQASNVTQFFTV